MRALGHGGIPQLREIATVPDRALVHVQTIVWNSAAGQHVAVVNVATGVTSRIWLSETTVAVGSFVVLERTDGGACALEWMRAHQVQAGHRHEQRDVAHRPRIVEPRMHLLERGHREAAKQLIAETEQFLKGQESI